MPAVLQPASPAAPAAGPSSPPSGAPPAEPPPPAVRAASVGPPPAVEVVITAEAFATRVLGARRPVVVDFCADWCGPSRAFAPVFDALAHRYGTLLDFVRVDTVVAPELARQQAVRSVPTLSVYRHGQPVKTVVGARPEAEIDRMLRRLARSTGPRLGLVLRWRRGDQGPSAP